jgi:hypothetical protein
MANDYQRVIQAVSELGRRVGSMFNYGTVEEVKKDKFRMLMGYDKDGKKVLGPWLDTGNHRGGARERRFYKKGQNVLMMMPTGDPAQAVQIPFAPNKDFGPPDHSNNSGQNEEVYQFEDLRVRKKDKGYEIWLEPKNNKGSKGGSESEQGGSGGNGVNEKIYLQKGSITGRVGKNWFVAHTKGAKLQAGNDYAVVTPGSLIVSREWVIGKDPIQQDDKGTPGNDSGGSGSQSGSGGGLT